MFEDIFPITVNWSFESLVMILAALLSLIVEFAPPVKIWFDRTFDSRLKPIFMALGVSLVAVALFYARCSGIIALWPAVMCDRVGLMDMLNFIAFGFGSNQLMFAAIRLLIPSWVTDYTTQRTINAFVDNMMDLGDDVANTPIEEKIEVTKKPATVKAKIKVVKKK